MRSEIEMLNMLVDFAEHDPRIRLATLEGSRTNVNIKPDVFQDYDISYFVTDIDSFKSDDDWLDAFGQRAMLQKPEAMELFHDRAVTAYVDRERAGAFGRLLE